MTRLTAITGGIGSGKSVVSRILRALGYDVFDCDLQAKLIMDSDPQIKLRISTEISPEAITPAGDIDRPVLSKIVFSDPGKLAALNAIVHQAVRDEIVRWSQLPHPLGRAFVETAILYQSGLHKIVDDAIEVIAPDEIRIQRVIRRNNCTEAQVRARIQSQTLTPSDLPATSANSSSSNASDLSDKSDSLPTATITNDNLTPILPQLLSIL